MRFGSTSAPSAIDASSSSGSLMRVQSRAADASIEVAPAADADPIVLETDTTAAHAPAPAKELSRTQRWRVKIFAFFSDPSSSRWAKYFGIYFNLLILFSTAAFCLQTVVSLNDSPQDTQIWWIIEIFVISQFTFEYTIRLATAPNVRSFVLAPLNIVDLIAIIPFYLELVVVAIFGTSTTIAAIAAIRIIRLVRVFRLFKLGQHSRQVRMVARAFARSRDGIFLLAFMLGLAVTFFSTCLYFAETASCTLIDGVWIYDNGTTLAGDPTEYQSILSAFWWALVTMTTVGYGDVFPITIAGKCVAAVAMVTGLLVIAFPITIIGVNLNDIYEEFREEQARKDRAAARARTKELFRARGANGGSDPTVGHNDLKSSIEELRSVQQKIHEELDGMRTRLGRLLDVEIHAEAMIDHLAIAQKLNEAMAALARLKVKQQAGLGRADESAPIMLHNDDDDGAGVESFTSTDILQMEPIRAPASNRVRWKPDA